MYGNLQAEVGSISQPYLFSTKRYDYQLGTYYYGFRFYSPSTGRWLTRDPLGEAGGLNLYQFNNDNPINYADSFGLCRQKGESRFGCANRVAKEVLGEGLDFVDSLGYWGIGTWAASAAIGNNLMTSLSNTAGKDAIKSCEIAGALEGGTITARMAAAERAAKTAARTALLKSGLAALSRVSGVVGLAASGSSALARILGDQFGNCSQKCSECE